MKKILILLFTFTLIFKTGLAVEENVVLELPTTQPVGIINKTAEESEYSPDSIGAYYGEFISNGDNMQWPKLTEDELARVNAIQTLWDEGKRPAESILNLTENVVLGVYELRPEDYDGETVFLILPVTVLSDDQILQIIDAYAQLGKKFEPALLSYRNCARGGGIEVTRFYSGDERERVTLLIELFKRQGLRAEKDSTPLPNDDGIGEIKLDKEAFCGLDSFVFYPFRRMTDDELFLRIAEKQKDIYNPEELSNLENLSRKELTRILNMPLATKLDYESKGIAGKMNVFLDNVEVYTPNFVTPTHNNTQIIYYANIIPETGKALYAHVFFSNTNLKRSDLTGDPYDAKWQDIAKAYVEALRKDGVKVKSTEARGETRLQDDGNGVTVWVLCEDDSFYEVRISYQTEQPGTITYYQTKPNFDSERMWGGY